MHIRNRFADDFHSGVPEITTSEMENGFLLNTISRNLCDVRLCTVRFREVSI
jgi:hypothetical protein